MMDVFDTRVCTLGEGPFWHPERQQFFWFDITKGQMLSAGGLVWDMGENASAAGWINHDTLLVATETALITFDLETGAREIVTPLEPDAPLNRSNDGRADPFGGFWIGTMGKEIRKGAGAIYRYYRGELRQLFPDISVPNAMCFAPDGHTAYWTDTLSGLVMKSRLDGAGWPKGSPEVFLDLRDQRLNPDGAVIDTAGNMWIALYGASAVQCYAPDGDLRHQVDVPARHTTCPAFGGPDRQTLFVTSAAQGLAPEVLKAEPENGMTFAVNGLATGQAEHRVVL